MSDDGLQILSGRVKSIIIIIMSWGAAGSLTSWHQSDLPAQQFTAKYRQTDSVFESSSNLLEEIGVLGKAEQMHEHIKASVDRHGFRQQTVIFPTYGCPLSSVGKSLPAAAPGPQLSGRNGHAQHRWWRHPPLPLPVPQRQCLRWWSQIGWRHELWISKGSLSGVISFRSWMCVSACGCAAAYLATGPHRSIPGFLEQRQTSQHWWQGARKEPCWTCDCAQ